MNHLLTILDRIGFNAGMNWAKYGTLPLYFDYVYLGACALITVVLMLVFVLIILMAITLIKQRKINKMLNEILKQNKASKEEE